MCDRIEVIRGTVGLFRLYGIRALSLEDIARLAGFPPRMLKRFFRSKEMLLCECVRYWINQEEIFKYTDDCLPDILINFAEAYPLLRGKVNRRCCLEIKKYYPDVYRFFREQLEAYALACRDKAEEGIRNGYVRRKVSPDLIYAFFYGCFTELFAAETGDGSRGLCPGGRLATGDILAFAQQIMTTKGRIYIDKELKKRICNETD